MVINSASRRCSTAVRRWTRLEAAYERTLALLAQCTELLKVAVSPATVGFTAFTIVAREGLEAIIILAALMAGLRGAEYASTRKGIAGGAWMGLIRHGHHVLAFAHDHPFAHALWRKTGGGRFRFCRHHFVHRDELGFSPRLLGRLEFQTALALEIRAGAFHPPAGNGSRFSGSVFLPSIAKVLRWRCSCNRLLLEGSQFAVDHRQRASRSCFWS